VTTAEGDDLRAGTEDVDEEAEEKLQLSELFLMRHFSDNFCTLCCPFVSRHLSFSTISFLYSLGCQVIVLFNDSRMPCCRINVRL